MKKKTSWLILILFLSYADHAVFAQMSVRQDRLGSSIEFSLLNLKQKAEKIVARNQWLWTQIQTYRKQLPVLQQHVHEFEIYAKARQATEKEHLILQEQDAFEYQRDYQNKNELLQEIRQIETEIHILQQKIQLAEKHIFGTPDQLEPEKKILLSQVKEARLRVHTSEEYLEQLQKRHGKRSEVYRSLLEKQNLLKEKLALLEDEMQYAQKEQVALKATLEKVAENQEKNMVRLNRTVIELRSESELLEKTLTRAHNKIKHKEINFEITDDELAGLKENLHIVEREQDRLYEEYNRLNERHEELQKKFGFKG